jgi:molybdopterin converting factor small subunit
VGRGGAAPAGRALGRSRGVVTVLLPGLLADQAGGRKEFQLEAPTVGAALRALPVRDLLFDERSALRPLVNIYVDGEDVRGRSGIDTELRDGQTVRVVAAVAGG